MESFDSPTNEAENVLAFLETMSKEVAPTSSNSTIIPLDANQPTESENEDPNIDAGNLLLRTLVDSLREGIIIVDHESRVRLWSHAVESMTGLTDSNMTGQRVTPHILSLRDLDGFIIEDSNCPIRECLQTGKRTCREFRIIGPSGREVKCEFTSVPVKDHSGQTQGAIVLVYDTSVQRELKQQLDDLHAISVIDPLTKVANRAEFERTLNKYVKSHHNDDVPCSLIICDIDFFKTINDTYGHHVGDQALVAFAKLLQQFVRAEDIVARFGGEEFVILCADCDKASAVERAEKIRQTLTTTKQPMLEGKSITASFGVSELTKDDDATDLFVRADKALLHAKESGRNRVVGAEELDDETTEMRETEVSSASGKAWAKIKGPLISCEEYVTTTPPPILVQKISGYIREIDAEIREVQPEHAAITVTFVNPRDTRKIGRFFVDIEWIPTEEMDENRRVKTYLRVTMRAKRAGFLQKNAVDLAPQVLRELRKYLMINEASSMLTVEAAATKSVRDTQE